MIYSAMAIPSKCGRGCKEECITAFPEWGMWGKGCSMDIEDPEVRALWNGVLKAKAACERHAIEIRIDGRLLP